MKDTSVEDYEDLDDLEDFLPSEADILQNKKEGRIYVADFTKGVGKYISISERSNDADVDIKLSPKINLRITYILAKDRIRGVEISKVSGTTIDKIHFSTMDFEKILQLLYLFRDLDLDSIANRSIVLNNSIVENQEDLEKFLELVVKDPAGREKLSEIARNYDLLELGDIDHTSQRKEAISLFETLLEDEEYFNQYQQRLEIGKKEEVWQQFFSENSWILGAEFIEILDERQLDVENITDYLLQSYDGFVDIVELKLPKEKFWTNELIPRSELTSASMQRNRYILETERRMNDLEFAKKIENKPIAKPRITLIYGRSNEWSEEEKEAYRVLNTSYSNLKILSYDHLLERAKRLTGLTPVS